MELKTECRKSRWTILFFGLGALGLVIRWLLFDFESNDYKRHLKPWYDFILQNGRIAAFRQEFSDYTPPYLYLLSFSTFFGLQPLHAIKVISLMFEILLVVVSFRVVRFIRPQSDAGHWAAVAVFLFPTVVFNGSLWGQCDVIHTSILIVALYLVLQRKTFWACLSYGVALSIKLQSIFLAPVFLILLLTSQISFANVLIVPCIYFLLILPCAVVGRSWESLLMIYFRQAAEYEKLTMNAPNIYQWIFGDGFPALHVVGIIVSAVLTGAIIVTFYWWSRGRQVKPQELVHLALLFAVLEPFFLPRMHERYFFIADILAVLYAYCRPDRWFLPFWIGGASLVSYFPFLFGREPVDLSIATLPMAAALIIVLMDFTQALRATAPPTLERNAA